MRLTRLKMKEKLFRKYLKVDSRAFLAGLFILVSGIIGIHYFRLIEFPTDLTGYFDRGFYNQFGALAIAVEMMVAGIYLFLGHPKTNFVMALFGFTVLADQLFQFFGVFSSFITGYPIIVFFIFSLVSFWMVVKNPFKLRKITWFAAMISFVLGNAVEVFFNVF